MPIRYKAMLAAGLAQVALFALFVVPSNLRWRGGAAQEPVAMVLSFFEPEERRVAPSLLKVAPSVQHQRTPTPATQASPPVLPDGAISESPIDWTEEARRASDATLSQQNKTRERRSFDFPKGMVPPPQQQDPLYGDIEHFEGGETIMWVSSRCYYISREIADFAANMGPGPRPMQRKLCKH